MPRRGALEGALRAGQRVASPAGTAVSAAGSSVPALPTAASRTASFDFEPRTSFLLPSQTPSWYPGHMQRALRSLPSLLARTTPVLPLVIEVRDARLPLTSINPAFERMLRQVYGMASSSIPALPSHQIESSDVKGKAAQRSTPMTEWEQRRLVVYTKRDLISPRIEQPLASAFAEHGQRVMFVDTRSDRDVKRIHKWALEQARALLKSSASIPQVATDIPTGRLVGALRHTSTPEIGVRIIIMGMPNVGKSTLLNALRRVGVGRGKAVATAPHPGHTRKVAGTVRITEQAARNEEGGRRSFSDADDPPIYVYDTPGIMVPFLGRGTRGSERGLKLALAAGIRAELFDSNMLADYLLFRFNLRHAYTLTHHDDPAQVPQPSYLRFLPIGKLLSGPTNDINELLEALAHRVPGALSKGGVADLDAAADFLIQRWRDGKLGPDEGDLDLGLNELSGTLLSVDSPIDVDQESAFGREGADEKPSERIRRLVRQHFVEVLEADDLASAATVTSTQETTVFTEDGAEPDSAADGPAQDLPVLLSNHQARKRAKATYLESQRVKYRAQGLIRDGPSGQGGKRSGRRGLHTSSRSLSMTSSAAQTYAPIGAAEFSQALDELRTISTVNAHGVALSISGGVDSMALAFLMARWREAMAPLLKVIAVIVDHGLRQESAEEAQLTRKRLMEIGIESEVRTIAWGRDGFPALPAANAAFEATARNARRLALLHFLRTHRLPCVLFGHHADDQVETAVLRAARGSRDVSRGTDGLGGMRGVESFGAHALLAALAAEEDGGRDWLHLSPFDQSLRIGRPLLRFPKSRLRATCQNAGLGWSEDPTNEVTEQNARNLVRKRLRALDEGHPKVGSEDEDVDVTRAVNWCLAEANPGSMSTSPLQMLRQWTRDLSCRRDISERRVVHLLDSITSTRSGSECTVNLWPSKLPADTDDADREQVFSALVNAVSPHPLNSVAARGLATGSASPSSPRALASAWLKEQPLYDMAKDALETSRPARMTVNGDVILTVKLRRSKDDPQSAPLPVLEATRSPLRANERESGRLHHSDNIGRYDQDTEDDMDSEWRLWDGRYFVRVLHTEHQRGPLTPTASTWSIRPSATARRVLPRIYLSTTTSSGKRTERLVGGVGLKDTEAQAAERARTEAGVRVDVRLARGVKKG